MKSKVVFAVLMAALCSAYGATVRTATEGFVTNRVTQAAIAATNYTDAAIAAIPVPPPADFSTSNAVLVATIEATAPAPGDYENISNRVMQAISMPGDEGHPGGLFTPRFVGRVDLAVDARSLKKPAQSLYPGELTLTSRAQVDAEGAAWGVWWPSFLDAWNTRHWVASEDYVDSAIAALPESVSPETVTNIVRECSLGGIWDAELEVWWTPVMVGGSLTYQATTNVNLNAEN